MARMKGSRRYRAKSLLSSDSRPAGMYAGDAVLGGVPAAESDPGEVKGLRPLLELVRKSPGLGRGACSRVSSRAFVRWAWERGRATARGRDGQFTGGRELRLCVPRCQEPGGCTSRILRARGSETGASGAGQQPLRAARMRRRTPQEDRATHLHPLLGLDPAGPVVGLLVGADIHVPHHPRPEAPPRLWCCPRLGPTGRTIY
jgi:hypothetical protein